MRVSRQLHLNTKVGSPSLSRQHPLQNVLMEYEYLTNHGHRMHNAADNKLVFSNYTDRYVQGRIAKVPKIVGTAANEGSALVYVPLANYTTGPSQAAMLASTEGFVCAAHNTSVMRHQTIPDQPTFRYHWAGNFTDISPVPWLGAYHYSDLYMLFGSYGIAPGEISNVERQTSEKMQNFFLAFVEDPSSLPASGWPEFDVSMDGGGQLLQFGADETVVTTLEGDVVEGICHINGATYDLYP
jgi:hypothetical protein